MQLFEGFEHEYVLAPAYGGIGDPDTYEGSSHLAASLDPSAWFDAFPGPDATRGTPSC